MYVMLKQIPLLVVVCTLYHYTTSFRVKCFKIKSCKRIPHLTLNIMKYTAK